MSAEGGILGAAAAMQDQYLDWATSAFNVHEARQNRRFVRNMSNTAHQREAADLRAAGMNPILTATGGSGASTPQGTAAHVEPMPAGSAMVNAMASFAQIEDVNSAARLKDEQANELVMSRALNLSILEANLETQAAELQKKGIETGKLKEEIENIRQMRRNLTIDEESSAEGLRQKKLETERFKAEARYYRGKGGEVDPLKKIPFTAPAIETWESLKENIKENWKRFRKATKKNRGATGRW